MNAAAATACVTQVINDGIIQRRDYTVRVVL